MSKALEQVPSWMETMQLWLMGILNQILCSFFFQMMKINGEIMKISLGLDLVLLDDVSLSHCQKYLKVYNDRDDCKRWLACIRVASFLGFALLPKKRRRQEPTTCVSFKHILEVFYAQQKNSQDIIDRKWSHRSGGFLKWWVSPTNPWGFPTKNDHFGVCEMGVPPFKETPMYLLYRF